MSKKLPKDTYHDIDIDYLRNKLKLKALQAKNNFIKKYPNIDLTRIREHSAKLLAGGALAGTLFLGSVATNNLHPADTAFVHGNLDFNLENPQEILMSNLKSILPKSIRPLTKDEEKKLESTFKSTIGIS